MAEDPVALKSSIQKILLETPFAILATVGDDGRPYARWMSPIFASGNLDRVLTLAAPQSRKVAHIRKTPEVSWVFHSPAFDEVITLHGHAEVDQDPMLRGQVWEAMTDKHRTFMLKNDDNLAFVVVITWVERIEHLRARLGQTKPTVLKP